MNKGYEFITAKDYIDNYCVNEYEVISTISYLEGLKKESLPNEFAV